MDNLDFDLEALRVFLAVVDRRSFREAARELSMPKSTVSKKVSTLESQLGGPLLQRTTRSMALTPRGEVLYQQGSAALSQLGEATRSLRDSEAEPTGILRITAPPTFAELFLTDVLATCAQQYPKMRLVIDLSDRMVDIVREGFDIALRVGPLVDSTTLKARLLGTGQTVTVASPRYLKTHGTPRLPTDLSSHECISQSSTRTANNWVFRVGRKNVSVPIKPRVSVNSFRLVANLAEAGLGIARAPAGLVTERLRKGRLVEVLSDFQADPMSMHAVFTAANQTSPRVRAFLELLSESLEVTDVAFMAAHSARAR